MDPCERYQQLIPAYLDGEVTAEQKGILESHLRKCPECRGVERRLKVLEATLRSLPRLSTSPEFTVALRTRIHLEERRARRPSAGFPMIGRVPAWGLLATAAAILLLVLLRPDERSPIPYHGLRAANVEKSLRTESRKLTTLARRHVQYVVERVPVRDLQSEGPVVREAPAREALPDSSSGEETLRLVASRIYRVSF
ncbi:MAG: zf-HC2 domain-containing protein [candidate division KSB1 bacterium]|nr:zf-HC2 domain-containing protein [candidate division KSB1 bacterium]